MGALVALLQDFWKADPAIDDENNDTNILKENGLTTEPSSEIKKLEGLFLYPTKHRIFASRKKKDTAIKVGGKENNIQEIQYKKPKKSIEKDNDNEIEK